MIKIDSIHVFSFQRINTDVIHICRRRLLSLQTITKENAKMSMHSNSLQSCLKILDTL